MAKLLNLLRRDNAQSWEVQDPLKRKQERIGDNIFKGEIKEIYPDIFSDDENVYYLDVYEDWAKRSGNNPFSLLKGPFNGQLISRNTRIRYLDKKTAWDNDWKKVAERYEVAMPKAKAS